MRNTPAAVPLFLHSPGKTLDKIPPDLYTFDDM